MIQKQKNIQQILYLSIFLVLVILCTIIVFALLVRKKQSEVFTATSKNQLIRSIDLYILSQEKNLKRTLWDYTFWDETIEFIKNRDIEWAKANLDPALNSFKFNGLYAYDLNLNKVHIHYDERYSFLEKLPLEDYIFKPLHKKKYIHSFVYIDSVLVEILGSTVHPTGDPQKESPPQGYLFYARVWDQDFIKEFSEVTSTKIKLINNLPLVPVKYKNEIHIVKPVHSHNGKTVAYVIFVKVLKEYSLFSKFSKFFIMILVFASICIVTILVYTTHQYINKPLALIEESLKSNSTEKNRELSNYSIEFSQIGNLISKFIQQKKELELAKNKAEESDRLKSAFLANMSHEIRSPLNGIIGFSELLKERKTDEKTVRYANYISGRSLDLLRIINDILDFSRIEAHQLEIIAQKFNLHSLTEELAGVYSIHNDNPESKTRIIFHLSEDLELETDYFRLKQVLINLIDNALKFTAKGTVEIGYRSIRNMVEFYVKDTGIGIPKNKTDLIFDRFRQINDSPVRQGGNGLGLSICKGIIELMNGEIRVISEENKGSTFYFSIPTHNKNDAE